jgi:hypothetical protein
MNDWRGHDKKANMKGAKKTIQQLLQNQALDADVRNMLSARTTGGRDSR